MGFWLLVCSPWVIGPCCDQHCCEGQQCCEPGAELQTFEEGVAGVVLLRTASPARKARVHFTEAVTAACGLFGVVPLEEETVRVSEGMVFVCAVWVEVPSGTSGGRLPGHQVALDTRGKLAARRWQAQELPLGVRW